MERCQGKVAAERMKIRILSSAFKDLTEGREFYERQGEALGAYFLDSLFSDIDSLALYAGIHRKVLGFHRQLSKRLSTIRTGRRGLHC